MTDIVERLRAITGQAGDHGDVQLCMAAADEIERLRLTCAERAAVQWYAGIEGAVRPAGARTTLRGLLERTELSKSDSSATCHCRYVAADDARRRS